MGFREVVLTLKLLGMLALGCPPVIAWVAYMYSLMGHEVKVNYLSKEVEVVSKEPKYEVTTLCEGWRLKAKTDVASDPFG